jgi:hypothetical protein
VSGSSSQWHEITSWKNASFGDCEEAVCSKGETRERYPTHADALTAAQTAAAEQELPGDTEIIEYEDDKGEWHSETASGRDRPHAVVKDTNT